MRLGVAVVHSRPRHPQTLGKDERFHRSLNAELLRGRHFPDLAACKRAFETWRRVYNGERPHEALDLATPASRYRISPWPFPEVLPPIEYAPGDLVRKVQDKGWVHLKGHRLRLPRAFKGEPVAFRAGDRDGLYQVYFCAHRLAEVDLGQPTPTLESVSHVPEHP